MPGILTEMWSAELAEKLYPSNSFIMESRDDSAWVSNKTVNLSEAGAAPTVVKNRTVFPAPLTIRTDAHNSYDIDDYTSTPSLIQDVEEVETAPDKRASIIASHANQMNLVIANEMLFNWAATNAGNIIRTTGGNVATNTPGATGNRKMLAIADLMKLKNLFDDMEVPELGRVLTLPSSMLNNLIENEKEILLSKDFRNEADIKDGVIMSILGFKLYKRGKQNIQRYTNAATPIRKAVGAASATSDNAGAIAWHPDFVRRAISATKMYYEEDSPVYYGNILSGRTRAGAIKWYLDQTGVAAIVEAAGA